MKVGIFLQHFQTSGGGEKHIGVVAEYLSLNGHDVEIICFGEADITKVGLKLHLDFSRIKLIKYDLKYDPDNLTELTKTYDLFINATIFSNLINKSKYGIAMLYFPIVLTYRYPIIFKRIIKKKLEILDSFGIIHVKTKEKSKYKLINLLRKVYKKQKYSLQSIDYLKSYKQIWTNSEYSKSWIKKIYNMDSKILYPPIDITEFNPGVKENIILSVGRFFPELYGHNKKQLQLIKFFKHAYDKYPEFKDYEYHLCGGVNPDQKEDKKYFDSCVKEAEGYPIKLHPNIEFNELKGLYSKAKIFWHAPGFEEDPEKAPEVFEHFGMTTVEAMSAGCIPVVIGMGGQVEIVNEGVNGYLWLTEDECIDKTRRVMKASISTLLSENAIKASKRFSKDEMLKKVKEYLKDII